MALFAFLFLARGGLSNAPPEESFAVRPVELARERVRPQETVEVPSRPRPAASKVPSEAEVEAPRPRPRVTLPGPSYPKAPPKLARGSPEKEGAVPAPAPVASETPAAAAPEETEPTSTPVPVETPGWEPPPVPQSGPPEAGPTPGYSDGEATPIHFPSIRFSELAQGQQISVMAVFDIRPDGSFEVSLSSGSGDPRLDQLALKTLRSWRWRPKVVGGKALASREELKVDVVR